jgi:hypothetical protein
MSLRNDSKNAAWVASEVMLFSMQETNRETEHSSVCKSYSSSVSPTYGRCLESRVQCAAVSTWRVPTKEPPHQNSVRREPWRNMAAIHGHRPGRDSSPPTTRNSGTSGWPQSANNKLAILKMWADCHRRDFSSVPLSLLMGCYKTPKVGGLMILKTIDG